MVTDRKQDIAIVAITKHGAETGRTLKALVPECHLYLPEKFADGRAGERSFQFPAAHLVDSLFSRYRHLVLIMATGIAVRLISTHISDKHHDPGVVVMDDSGKFVISLLSGHMGGANELARRLSSLSGAQPVITTASDTTGATSLDLLCQQNGWEIEGESELTRVSAALVNGEPVGIYRDAGETGWSPDELSFSALVFKSIEDLKQSDCKAAIVITTRLIDVGELPVPAVIIRPKSLVAGIGCNRGTSCSDIEEAVTRVFSESGLSTKCIAKLATIDLKKDEIGLLQFAEKYHLPVEYFCKDVLSTAAFPSPPSALTLKYVGTPAVCEAASILSTGNSLIVHKTVYKRKITLAIAPLSMKEREKRGKLYVVGTGPGYPEHMTLRARQAISLSEVIVGYGTYIDQIAQLLTSKEIISTGMGKEIERVNRAIDMAIKGKKVALVSGGDSGVYGMSGAVGEVLYQRGLKLDIEVIPGVPSMVAAGALLGAPLTGDVATISLSDHLVSWQQIARRLHLATQGDFVITLYNPKSKGRRHQLEEALKIVLQYRSKATPAGIVANAYRPEQNIVITDLEHVTDQKVDMNTIIVIGNTSTFTFNDWMVTPRGYRTKYNLGNK